MKRASRLQASHTDLRLGQTAAPVTTKTTRIACASPTLARPRVSVFVISPPQDRIVDEPPTPQ